MEGVCVCVCVCTCTSQVMQLGLVRRESLQECCTEH